MKNKHVVLIVVAAVAAGYVFAPQIQKIPVVGSKLPQF